MSYLHEKTSQADIEAMIQDTTQILKEDYEKQKAHVNMWVELLKKQQQECTETTRQLANFKENMESTVPDHSIAVTSLLVKLQTRLAEYEAGNFDKLIAETKDMERDHLTSKVMEEEKEALKNQITNLTSSLVSIQNLDKVQAETLAQAETSMNIACDAVKTTNHKLQEAQEGLEQLSQSLKELEGKRKRILKGHGYNTTWSKQKRSKRRSRSISSRKKTKKRTTKRSRKSKRTNRK